ncbi:hypothetical protein ARALYDRAFT_898882 [Arabidopsis lyrata subsp. lyrata]|uniref:Gnk2-homologous domain-containing protein n=1 Tax=Arabidopsis lyrata subsp. lyrata TaxID=81972 RepID=D7L3E0_ARALL|nr:hypothetical protein ARALYDRAFT_898882 [Arabidopsis lyrata subsp. lyrata]
MSLSWPSNSSLYVAFHLTNQYLNHKCFVSEGKYKHDASVTIILQCRGDSFGSNCGSCYVTAIDGVCRGQYKIARASSYID